MVLLLLLLLYGNPSDRRCVVRCYRPSRQSSRASCSSKRTATGSSSSNGYKGGQAYMNCSYLHTSTRTVTC